MEPISMEWIDKIFKCLDEFYGDRWRVNFKKPSDESFHKTIWKNGLMGLSYAQIKNTLVLCKRHSMSQYAKPPHVMEFFKYAIGDTQPPIIYDKNPNERGNPEVARKFINEIKEKTRGYVDLSSQRKSIFT